MCNCKTEMEEALTKRLKELYPDSTNHRIELAGYGFSIKDGRMVLRGYMPAVGQHLLKTKGGILKVKKVKDNVIFSYCPFCGEKE